MESERLKLFPIVAPFLSKLFFNLNFRHPIFLAPCPHNLCVYVQMDGKTLLHKLSQGGTNLETTLQEIEIFLTSCEELVGDSPREGAKQLRLLAEKGSAFTTATKNKLGMTLLFVTIFCELEKETVLKFTLQFDILCRKDGKRKLNLSHEEHERVSQKYFSVWRRCLDILFSNKPLLKLNNEGDLER